MNTHDHNSHPRHLTPPAPPGADDAPPRDDLDGLLRQWHQVNADRAAAGRERLLSALAAESAAPSARSQSSHPDASGSPVIFVIRRIVLNRYSPLAAAAILLAVALPFILPKATNTAVAQLASNVVMAPDGGRLDALDADGNTLGPCALRHTDVKAEISGNFSRVTLTQQYHNPYKDKIEAVYTFPLSNRSAVDRMTMTIGERVVVGEVKEREQARQIYENAKAGGRIASLLEQERPNIFTQSVANIEPGADISIQISYVELLQQRDGQYTFDFPTVVGPRYIPGEPAMPSPGGLRQPIRPIAAAEGVDGAEATPLPASPQPRTGLILLAPPAGYQTIPAEGTEAFPAEQLGRMLTVAAPVKFPGDAAAKTRRASFEVTYPDGSKEMGAVFREGFGQVNNRWFYCPPSAASVDPGSAFAPDTNQVPDASKITPMPVRPGTRAGHDLSISVTIDTGGPGLLEVQSPLHQIVREDGEVREDGAPRRTTISLKNEGEIPNRDFVLNWKQTSDRITDSVFTHTGEHGNFFCITLQPPARVDDQQAVPRELVFVLDTSGSMRGFPIEKSKAVVAKAIASMRPMDTFNIVTFSGATKILWPDPRPASDANQQEAQAFLSTLEGRGGTEMMTAINAALTVRPDETRASASPQTINVEQLAALPSDGRVVDILAAARDLNVAVQPGITRGLLYLNRAKHKPLSAQAGQWADFDSITKANPDTQFVISGRWISVDGKPRLEIDSVTPPGAPRPARFLSPAQLAELPADGREVTIRVYDDLLDSDRLEADTTLRSPVLKVREGLTIQLSDFKLPPSYSRKAEGGLVDDNPEHFNFIMTGVWKTVAGQRLFDVRLVRFDDADAPQPVRIVTFFTDGFVGNDLAIIDAIKKNRATTRVFSFGIGNSVNRFLLDGMAAYGGGEAEYVLLNSDADSIVERFARRTKTPVLTNISVTFSDNLKVLDTLPAQDNIPDLFDVKPLTIFGRYNSPGSGQVTIRGTTAAGPWHKTIKLNLPASDPAHDTVATLWARNKIDAVMANDLTGIQQKSFNAELKNEIIRLGETFGIMSQFTSFVAVDKLRVTIDGKPRLVTVPIELPEGTDYYGFFGEAGDDLRDFDGGEKEIKLRAGLEALREQERKKSVDEVTLLGADRSFGSIDGTRKQAPPNAKPDVHYTTETIAGGGGGGRGSGGPGLAPPPAGAANPPTSPSAMPVIAAPGSPVGEAANQPSRSAAPANARPTATKPAATPAAAAPNAPPEAAPATTGSPAPADVSRGLSNLTKSKKEAETRAEGMTDRLASGSPGDGGRQSGGSKSDTATGTSAPAQQTQLSFLYEQMNLADESGKVAQVSNVRRAVRAQEVALRVTELTNENRLADAEQLACTLAEIAPTYDIGQELCQTLRDKKVEGAEQLKAVEELGRRARIDLDSVVRAEKLHRRLDQRLWLVAFGEDSKAAAAVPPTTTAACSNTISPDALAAFKTNGVTYFEIDKAKPELGAAVLITILVTTPDQPTLDALAAAGLKIESVSKTASVVIGSIPIDKLRDLTLLDQVRRIEPTPAE